MLLALYLVALPDNPVVVQRSLVVLLRTDEMMRSYELPPAGLADYRRFAGEGVFRLSVGLESVADVQADLAQALAPSPSIDF